MPKNTLQLLKNQKNCERWELRPHIPLPGFAPHGEFQAGYSLPKTFLCIQDIRLKRKRLHTRTNELVPSP